MKRVLTVALAASALACAAPALAQPYGYASDRAERLEIHIDQGVRDGSLTPGEAANLRYRLERLEARENRYRANGLSYGEARDLDSRYDSLSADLRYQRDDNQYSYRRYDRYDW